VNTVTEPQVLVRSTLWTKLLGSSEMPFVAVGCAEHDIHQVAGTQTLTVDLHVAGDPPPTGLDRTLEP